MLPHSFAMLCPSCLVGRVSRRVCLVHYPEPEELEKSATGRRSEGKSSHWLAYSALFSHVFCTFCVNYSRVSLGINDLPSFSGPMSRSMSRLTGSRLRSGSNRGTGATHDTLTSAHSMDQRSEELSPKSSKKRRKNTSAPIVDTPTRSAGRPSHASEPESQMTNTTSGSELSRGDKSKKKKKNKTKVQE